MTQIQCSRTPQFPGCSTLTKLLNQIAVTTHSGSTSHVTANVLAGTTPVGSSSHVTTDVLAGTTPLESSSHVTAEAGITPLGSS